ncbi:T9SS type A sorting domain-containing protein [Flavobacterium sp.]|uniref:T9SS type A sorting domain-containing protein n=1 Tax=Flavobacterium sp. TaxID=239 RepID=UPI003D6B1517
MKKQYFLLLALGLFTGVNAQVITIPNANFKAKLLAASPSNQTAKNLAGDYFKIDANSDGEIQQSEALNVSFLSVTNSSLITDLTGISYFTNITSLICNGNRLTSLSLINNTALTNLDCSGNSLESLNVSNNLALITLNCYANYLPSLNLNNNTLLTTLDCNSNIISSLNLNNNTLLTTLNCSVNAFTSLNINSNTLLTYLNCYHNQLTSLNLNNNLALNSINCESNNLTSLNVGSNTQLSYISCSSNQITALDISNNLLLNNLYCSLNNLTNLDVNNNSLLSVLWCYSNQLTNLDVSNNILLNNLRCQNNLLTSLNLSNNTLLNLLLCDNNELTSLFIKNGINETNITFSQNPTLLYVCADEGQFANIQSKITSYGYTNCHLNSYCSFAPGGIFYTIQGQNKFDGNNNGCDVSDNILSNLRFNITSGATGGRFISNATGNYSIPVIAGTHTLTPVFENSSYFTVSPSNVTVTFPTQASPFTQSFCVSANGNHPDLEITMMPLQAARPGFYTLYKLVYKNKGNTIQSGTINVNFNDAVLDLISSNPAAAATTNNLSWNFTNLMPFEIREITFTLKVNSPMETPAVNSGDILNYTTTITSPATDDMPNDNTFVLHQSVVNSFDPNDKTCLEGTTIAPGKVGEYVHYMIRFENTGTFPAQNIVVKDMIDTAKFDINSLIPIRGSHSFVTKITGNKVEFIFENINLPFDNANNDGYVAFKIKTKPTLVLGNTFSNSASIYFDYNFPIVTNTVTTTIAALQRQDFEFSNYFNLYPNPTHNVLNIDAKDTITITSISIYNALGQLVLVIPNAQKEKSVDVSSLSSGNYFIKINSDKGTSNTKFIKN